MTSVNFKISNDVGSGTPLSLLLHSELLPARFVCGETIGRQIGPEVQASWTFTIRGVSNDRVREALIQARDCIEITLSGILFDETDNSTVYRIARIPHTDGSPLSTIESYEGQIAKLQSELKELLACEVELRKDAAPHLIQMVMGLEEGSKLAKTAASRRGPLDPRIHTKAEVDGSIPATWRCKFGTIFSLGPEYIYEEPAVFLESELSDANQAALLNLAQKFNQDAVILEFPSLRQVSKFQFK